MGVFFYLVPVSVCGARQKLRLTVQARFLPTAAHAAPSLVLPLAALRLAALPVYSKRSLVITVYPSSVTALPCNLPQKGRLCPHPYCIKHKKLPVFLQSCRIDEKIVE